MIEAGRSRRVATCTCTVGKNRRSGYRVSREAREAREALKERSSRSPGAIWWTANA
ncbi:hypothetical protein WME88_00425 [Sorangium sp. So ce216]